MSRILAFLLLALGVSLPALAHTPSRSFGVWTVEGTNAQVVVQTDARRVTLLSSPQTPAGSTLDDLFLAEIARSISLTTPSGPCTGTPKALPAPIGQVRAALRFTCPAPIAEGAMITAAPFAAVSPDHIHYVRLSGDAGEREAALSRRETTLEIGAGAKPESFFDFIRTGAEHVLGGIDHLAFILALALLAGSLRAAAWAATGFTLGHSITLGLVAVGWLQPNEAAIEALIGFTIAFAAAEAFGVRHGGSVRQALIAAGLVLGLPFAAWMLGFANPPWLVYAGAALFIVCAGALGPQQTRGAAPVLAAAFGLAHGAGFAGALQELALPAERLVPALLAFNIGVELAQILALAVIGLAALGLRRAPIHWQGRALDATTAALFALGVFWFVERTFLV